MSRPFDVRRRVRLIEMAERSFSGTRRIGTEHLPLSDPGMLTKAYADLFTRKGGWFIRGDARSLASGPSGWSVTTEMMSIEAREAVVALGPWSDDVFGRSATTSRWL